MSLLIILILCVLISVAIAIYVYIAKIKESEKLSPSPPLVVNPTIFIPSTELDKYLKDKNMTDIIKIGGFMGAVVAYYATKYVAKKAIQRGSIISAKIATKSATNALKSIKSVATLAKAGKISRLGLKLGKASAAMAKITLHATNPLTWALIVFDIVNIGLDLGDAGGYDNLGSNAFYDKLKAQLEYNSIVEYTKEKIPYPVIAGPFDEYTDDAFETDLTAGVTKILDDPNSVYLTPLTNAITAANLTNESDISAFIEANFEKYVNIDKVIEQAEKDMCATKNGKWADMAPITATSDNQSATSIPSKGCSWKPEQCVSKWPLSKDDDIYKEWDDGKGACIIAPFEPRRQCDTDGAKYDLASQKCVVDKNYCFQKGADWKPNPKNNNIMDCMIGTGQDIAEFIFGTTISRDIKRLIASASRPADCPAGYTNTGLTCYRAPDSQVQDSKNATCTNPSYPIHEGLFCGQRCPDGWRDDGLFCAKPASYGVGAGYPWKFGDDIGRLDEARQRCARNNPQGCEQDGQIIYPKCKPGFQKFGCCVCTPKCSDAGLGTDIGVSCAKNTLTTGQGMGCDSGWTLDKNLGKCFKNCQTGYTDMGLTCLKTASSLPTSSMTCKSDETLMKSNGRCIKNIN